MKMLLSGSWMITIVVKWRALLAVTNLIMLLAVTKNNTLLGVAELKNNIRHYKNRDKIEWR